MTAVGVRVRKGGPRGKPNRLKRNTKYYSADFQRLVTSEPGVSALESGASEVADGLLQCVHWQDRLPD